MFFFFFFLRAVAATKQTNSNITTAQQPQQKETTISPRHSTKRKQIYLVFKVGNIMSAISKKRNLFFAGLRFHFEAILAWICLRSLDFFFFKPKKPFRKAKQKAEKQNQVSFTPNEKKPLEAASFSFGRATIVLKLHSKNAPLKTLQKPYLGFA